MTTLGHVPGRAVLRDVIHTVRDASLSFADVFGVDPACRPLTRRLQRT
jgi:hypothetical protein